MNQKHITIKGLKIDAKKLTKDPKAFKIFKRKWMGDPAVPEFLMKWWDKKETITAYTSGSTGIPKRIELNKDYALKSARATLDKIGLKKGNTAMLSMPAHYIAGRMMLVRAIEGELNLIPVRPASIPDIPNEEIDLAAFTPHQFQSIIQSTDNNHYRNIKNILLGGSPVQIEMGEQLTDFPGRIFETFGMTETYSHVAIRQIHPVRDPFFSAMESVTFSTKDDKLVIHAPHIGIDALETNDIVKLDGNSRFQWLGRADNIINSGGIKIHPELIENKLAEIIKAPFFITGKSDKKYGEKVVLIVERDPDTMSEKQLQKLIKDVLDKYEKPKAIIWVDNMIMTPTGKINRAKTKMRYMDH